MILKFLFDWFVAVPARIIDYLLLCALGFAALAPPMLAWHWTIKIIESSTHYHSEFPARPARLSTWVPAIAIALYVTLVCIQAVGDLPLVFRMIENSN